MFEAERSGRSTGVARTRVSRPSAMAPTPTRISTPSALRMPSPAPIERFIAREHLAADDQREARGWSRRRARRRAAAARWSALAPDKRGAGEDEAEDRARAGRPQQAGGDAEEQRTADAGAAVGAGRTGARRGRPAGASRAVGEVGEDQQQREAGQQRERDPAAIAVGGDRPAAADRGERGDPGEGQRHAAEQGQAVGQERAVAAREHERQHRQDARAEDGEDAAEIGEEDDAASGGPEDEREAVDAVALAGRLGAVVEDMAEVPAAAAAMFLGARHAEQRRRAGARWRWAARA